MEKNKNVKISNSSPVAKKNEENIHMSFRNKIDNLQEIVKRTILAVQKYKIMDVFGANELNVCIQSLENIFSQLNILLDPVNKSQIMDTNQYINKLQEITNELSSLFRTFGTNRIDDLIMVCFGNEFINKHFNTPNILEKYKIMKQYVHPIGYKVMTWKTEPTKKTDAKSHVIKKNRIVEDFMIVETAENLECFDLARTSNTFQTKVYGIKFAIHNHEKRKTLIVCGMVDDLMITCLNYDFISKRIQNLNKNKPDLFEFKNVSYERFISSLTLKELLIHSDTELYDRYMGYINQVYLIKQKTISQVTKEFICSELYAKRTTLIQLLLKSNEHEFQYLSYLLYDLLSDDLNGNVDTQEQTILFDSLPWSVKKYFRNAMKQTINYTNNLTNFDNTKIPLEQQICLMKADDSVKEKAMQKLKEVKAKSEDTGSKARQYLDGLMKIPFGIYKEEPILKVMDECTSIFNDFIKKLNNSSFPITGFPQKNKYTSMEMRKYSNILKNNYSLDVCKKMAAFIKEYLTNTKRNTLISNIYQINYIIKNHSIKLPKICYSGKTATYMKKYIEEFIDNINENTEILIELATKCNINKNEYNVLSTMKDTLNNIDNKTKYVSSFMQTVDKTFDAAVHGHKKAKRQIERIIGQWINGDKSGYCFGFEGPPGVGKCHLRGTPIMLSNGKIKKVENIKVGDKIMGDNSTSRNVLALGRGIEKMYEIQPVKGDSYVVNESHILSLKMTKAGRKGDKHQTIMDKRYYKNDIVDICIKDYIDLPQYLKECLKGYRVGVDFPKKHVDLDPYVLGYWLGDGTSNCAQITTIEESVVEYFRYYCEEFGLKLHQGKDSKTTRHSLHYNMSAGKFGGKGKNPILNMLRKYKVLNNKHIPHVYKCNSRDIQLELLAGIIDSDGSLHKNGGYDIIQKNEKLLDDIIFIARSLGFAAYKTICKKSCMYKGEKKEGTYYRTFIHGEGVEYIPVKVERKKSNNRKQIKDALNTGIKVIPLEEDEYYGFQIDGNSRFLLGDFTVTHNTSLAKKGIANCLKDDNYETRPFAFIAIGGSSNGSTLDGHNYTYVGSTWGRIVDVLMENKCMNPIIFIDELDKVSRTEHGKELIGILTHLIDQTQNDCFQDKYFNGIDLDLSKALFIFSYNDADAIDRILLDRIHRIKFDHLSLDDKLVITKDYLFPEIFKKMGLEGMIEMEDDVIEYIIDEWTCEPGVRKLKEILFEIVGEINLSILKNNDDIDYEIPIKITHDDIKYKYLKGKHELKIQKIHTTSQVGLISGLWANSLGRGGVLPIEVQYYPSGGFLDLKLTGMQGDVMKESMTVAKTLAWSLLSKEKMSELQKDMNETKYQGIHIHVPEGATPKDGPSAGTAITVVLYSLFSNKRIKHEIAITGEMCLQGKVTGIGGLDLKFLGGIRAGVKCFIFPKDNEKDFKEFMEKYENQSLVEGIEFKQVETIQEVLDLVFED